MQKKNIFFQHLLPDNEGIEEVVQPESERTPSTQVILEPEKSFGVWKKESFFHGPDLPVVQPAAVPRTSSTSW